MIKHWWKALGVLILIYTITVGMLVPLKPGIVEVRPSSVKTGDAVNLYVRGYNSHFEKAGDSLQAWLKLDDERALKAANIKVKNDRELEIAFQIPPYLPVEEKVQDMALILDNAVDGPSVLPSAVFITQDSIDPSRGQTGFQAKVTGLHDVSGMTFPFRNILKESIRNQYFHVPMWFAMLLIFTTSVVYSIRYLRKQQIVDDEKAVAFTQVGTLFGILGIVTGALWAKNTWGAYWSWDIKQNMSAIALLIYLAYFILRSSFDDQEKKARISAVYNIFAFSTLIPLLYVIPRLTDSLHPGAGGNPAFGGEDLDSTMRMVFYPAIIGYTLLGVWMANLSYRAERIKTKLLEDGM